LQTLKRAKLRHACQIPWRSVEQSLRYGDYSIFQDGGRRYFGFLLFFEILTVGHLKRVELRNPVKFHGDGSNCCGDRPIVIFRFFQDGGS